jgi:hypothetical protein
VRDERLSRDGQTFTALTPLPRTLTPAPKEYVLFQEYNLLAWFTTSVTLPTHMAHYVNIASVNQVAQLAAVFDQYMIEECEIWIVPEFTPAANSLSNGLMSSVIDLDDANVLTTFAEYGDYTNCVTTQSGQGHYRHFIPHVAIAAYQGTFVGFANVSRQWIDMGNTTVQHYGLKLGSTVTAVAVQYSLVVRLKCRFRSAR